MPKGKLPKWAWVAAIGVGLIVAYLIFKRSSSADTASDGISPQSSQQADGGGGGGGGLASSSPLEPVSSPTPAAITVGDVVSTLQDPTPQPTQQQQQFAAPQFAPLEQQGTPYATAPALPAFDTSKTQLPSWDPSQTTLPAFHLQPLVTPSLASSTPSTYGGVLSPERA